jgi:hypothetical protein
MQSAAMPVMRWQDVRSVAPGVVAIMACLAQLALGQPGGVQPGLLADTATASRIPWDTNDAIRANQVTPLGWGSTTLASTGSGQGIGQRTVMYAGQDAIYGTLSAVLDEHVPEVVRHTSVAVDWIWVSNILIENINTISPVGITGIIRRMNTIINHNWLK